MGWGGLVRVVCGEAALRTALGTAGKRSHVLRIGPAAPRPVACLLALLRLSARMHMPVCCPSLSPPAGMVKALTGALQLVDLDHPQVTGR